MNLTGYRNVTGYLTVQTLVSRINLDHNRNSIAELLLLLWACGWLRNLALSLPEVELVDETLAAKLAGERPLPGVLLHPVAVLDWNHSSCFALKDWQQSKGHLQYVTI